MSSWAPVALEDYRCRDQEVHGLRPGRANSFRDPLLKISNTKKGLMEWLK
jgi:hypothetical protein